MLYVAGELVLAKVIQAGNMENGEAGNGMTNTNIHSWEKKTMFNPNWLILHPYINYTLVNTQCTYI